MNKALFHLGDENGCGACVINYLGLSKDLVNSLILQASYEKGIDDREMLSIVKLHEKKHKDEQDHKISLSDDKQSKFVYYGLYKTRKNSASPNIIVGNIGFYNDIKKTLGPIKNDSLNYLDNLDSALSSIFKIIQPGYASILNILWERFTIKITNGKIM